MITRVCTHTWHTYTGIYTCVITHRARGWPGRSLVWGTSISAHNQNLSKDLATWTSGSQTPSYRSLHLHKDFRLGAGLGRSQSQRWHPTDFCPLPAPPTRSGPVLVLLSLGEAPHASHLGLGWASASWLPRLTWSWVAASSELSECRRWVCREWVRVRLLPQPTEQPSTHYFPFPFETRVVNLLGSTESPALLPNPRAHHSGLHISL